MRSVTYLSLHYCSLKVMVLSRKSCALHSLICASADHQYSKISIHMFGESVLIGRLTASTFTALFVGLSTFLPPLYEYSRHGTTRMKIVGAKHFIIGA